MLQNMQTPTWIQRIFSSLVWRIPTQEKVLYLTFDDGPIPVVTPWVIRLLEEYRAKGTFFCVGANVRKYPEVYAELLRGGHKTGNHTEHHTNGWTVYNRIYFKEVFQCARVVRSRLFRPPYGKIRFTQIARLKKDYRIVMWDVLSKDYDPDLTGEQVADRVIRSAGPGSIVVFHDSLKAEPRLRTALPAVLAHFSGLGYRFEVLPL